MYNDIESSDTIYSSDTYDDYTYSDSYSSIYTSDELSTSEESYSFENEYSDIKYRNKKYKIFKKTIPKNKHLDIRSENIRSELIEKIETENKFALLMGGDCNYDLKDACNKDIYAIYENLLLKKYRMLKENIIICGQTKKNSILNEISNSAVFEMNRDNLEKVLEDLLLTLNEIKGKVFLFIHYSGHGYRLRDKKTNRRFNNGICVDKEFYLKGTELMKSFFSKLRKGINIFCLWDACHTGSFLDLPYRYLPRSDKWVKSNEYPKFTNLKCRIMSISACDDEEFEIQVYDNDKNYHGSLTASFLKIRNLSLLIDDPEIILNNLRAALKRYKQNPILSSNVGGR